MPFSKISRLKCLVESCSAMFVLYVEKAITLSVNESDPQNHLQGDYLPLQRDLFPCVFMLTD